MLGTSTVLVLIATVLTGVYLWVKHHLSYWKRKNVPYLEPSFIFGNLKELVMLKVSPSEHIKKMYFHEKAKDEPVIGMHIFHQPCLFVRDPDLAKQILIKDFNKFSDRFTYTDPKLDPLGYHNIFFIPNPQWKQIRSKLTPVFTSGKIKQMFSLIEDIGCQLDSYLLSLPMDPKTNAIEQELKDLSALYTTDVIANVAYGIQSNSIRNPQGEFRRNGRLMFEVNTLFRAVEWISIFFLPKLVSWIGARTFSKDSADFMRTAVHSVMKEREKSGTVRHDLIDILISYKNESKAAAKDKDEIVFEGDVLVAQAAVFFSAGFETSSSAMSFGLYELSKQPELQKRLRQEIKEVLIKNNGKLTYEAIQGMEYLNMVLQEIFRLYPPLAFLDRKCTLPKGEKGYSLEPFSDFEVPNGMPVFIPIYAMHRDPKYFPDPDTFNPERFAPENKDNIVPYTYMPFGLGPHNCIGERFGIIQAKVGIISLLRNHYARASAKTPKVMKLQKGALVAQPDGGVFCEIVRDPLI